MPPQGKLVASQNEGVLNNRLPSVWVTLREVVAEGCGALRFVVVDDPIDRLRSLRLHYRPSKVRIGTFT